MNQMNNDCDDGNERKGDGNTRKCFELSTPRDHSVIAHTTTTTRIHVFKCVTDTVLPLKKKDIMGICD